MALIGIGNNGFSKMKITKVLVNTAETPTDAKLQESNLIDGCTLTENYNSQEGKGIAFKNIDDVNIKRGTSPAENFEKSDDGTASEKDIIYGIHTINNQAITDVHITYKYLGISFTKKS